MTYDLQTGSKNLRTEVVDSMIKQIAQRAYKFKQAVSIVPTSAWKNTFFREDTTILNGQPGNRTKGIPRGANFPQATVKWEEVSVRIIKHGQEENLIWEDILADDINVQARTIFKVTEAVIKSVDDDIWSVLSEDQSPNKIQEVAITEGRYWDASSQAILDNMFECKQKIQEKNYSNGNLLCFINPAQERYVLKAITDSGAQYTDLSEELARNGKIARIAGITLVTSNSVSASEALIVVPKVCGTYKELVSLRSDLKTDAFKSVRVRVVEEGVVELTDPLAVVLISNIFK